MPIEFFDTEVDLTTPVVDTVIQKPAEPVTPAEPIKTAEGDTIIDLNDEPGVKEGSTTGTDDTGVEEGAAAQKDTKAKTPSKDDAGSSSSKTYSTIARALAEEGVLSSYDEEEFTQLAEELGSPAEALIELHRRTIADEVEAWKAGFTDEQRELIDAIGKGVPLNKFVSSKSKQLEYSGIKEDQLSENDALCKTLIADHLRVKGFDDDEINDQLADIESLGKLETKAKVALESLKKHQSNEVKRLETEAEAQRKAAAEAQQQQRTKLKKDIDALSEIIPGAKINAQTKTRLFDLITKPAAQLQGGQWINEVFAKRVEDPMAFDIKLAYLYHIGVFDGKWDKVLSAGKSSAAKTLEKALESGVVSKDGIPAGGVDTDGFGTPKAKDILRSMEIFKKK